MREYELYVSLQYKDGTPIEGSKIAFIKKRFFDRFGGFIHYHQQIAGTWQIGNATFHKEMAVFRIIAGELEQPRDFFLRLKEELISEFKLEDVAIVERKVEIL